MKKLLLKVVVILGVLYTFLGFFILPYFIQFSTPPFLKKQYGIEVYIDSVHFNPYNFSFKLSNLILKDEERKKLLYFGELLVDLDPISLLNGTIYIKKILLDNARINIEFDKNKKGNFQFLVEKFVSDESAKETKSSSSALGLYIEQFELSFFTFVFKDDSKAELFDIETKPINLTLNDISLDTDHHNKIDIQLQTQKSGEVHLQSDFVVDPLSATGSIKLNDIVLDKFYYYAKPVDLKLEIDSKVLNSSFSYDFMIKNDTTHLTLSDIKTQLPKTILAIDQFEFLLEQYLLNIDGVMLQLDANTTHYSISGIKSTLAQLAVEDKTYKNSLKFYDLNTSVQKFSSNTSEAIEVSHTLKTPLKGKLALNASLVQEPLDVTGKLNLKKIDLVPYKSYIEEFVNLDLISAILNMDGKFQYQQNGDKNNIELNSNIVLNKIDIQNSAMKQPIIQIDTIDISKLHYKNDALKIKKIQIQKPDLEFYLNENNTTNFTRLIKETKKGKTAQDQTQKKQEKEDFAYTIDELFIQDGEAKFFDNSLKTPFKSHETDVNVYVKNITSKKDHFTQIEHDSIVDQYGILKAKGSLTLNEPLKDLVVELDVRNIDLPSLSAYSGKFIGQKIDKGKLSLKFDHKITDRRLQLKNNLRIKDIKLGEKIQSKEAIDAPIGLAIALLEDSEGYIDLDIPIDGDLDNPNFHISDVIFDVIRNTIVGIVSAPFKFLGAIIGIGSGDDLDKSYFDYGEATIEAETKEKLDKVVQALEKRPGLELKIKPSYLVDEDSEALIQKSFELQYAPLLDITKDLETRLDELSEVFINLYSKEEFDAIELEDAAKLEFMLAKVKQTIKVSKKDLESLASQRAINIKEYFIAHKIASKRIEVLEEFDTSNKEKRLEQVVVNFTLGINK